MKNPMKRLILIFLDIPITETFTPLEKPQHFCRGCYKYKASVSYGEQGQSHVLSNGVFPVSPPGL